MAGRGKVGQRKRCAVRTERQRQRVAVWTDQRRKFRCLGLHLNRLKACVEGQAKLEDSVCINANEGGTVDMTRFWVLGVDHHGLSVTGRLEQCDEVFPCCMLFPHASGRGSNLGELSQATTLDALTNRFVSLAPFGDGEFNVGVFHRLRADFHNVFARHVNIVELNRHHGLNIVTFCCSIKGLGCGDLGQLALAQCRPVKGGGGDGGWQVVFLFLQRSDGGLILRFNSRCRSGCGRGSGTGTWRRCNGCTAKADPSKSQQTEEANKTPFRFIGELTHR